MLAADAATAADRACLMTMRQAWLALAENEDWLEGAFANKEVRHGPQAAQVADI